MRCGGGGGGGGCVPVESCPVVRVFLCVDRGACACCCRVCWRESGRERQGAAPPGPPPPPLLPQLGPFDGIFWDTYGEFYEDMADFHDHLPRHAAQQQNATAVHTRRHRPPGHPAASTAAPTHPAAHAAAAPGAVRRLLRPGGVYSFFNGLAPDNMFFHLVRRWTDGWGVWGGAGWFRLPVPIPLSRPLHCC